MSFEYGLSSALNAVGFMETLCYALKLMGFNSIPDFIFQVKLYDVISINPMACLLIFLLTLLLLKGIKDSIMVNNIFTMCILAFFMYCNTISVSIFKPELMSPFFAGGVSGVMRGAALCFFGYTSFE
jgi:basic amino acid/polyamine antiporter, APA family